MPEFADSLPQVGDNMSDTFSVGPCVEPHLIPPDCEMDIAYRLQEVLNPRRQKTGRTEREEPRVPGKNPPLRIVRLTLLRIVRLTLFFLLFTAAGLTLWSIGLRSIVGIDLPQVINHLSANELKVAD